MGIVVITIPGNRQQAFVRALCERTKGCVDLVIIQKPKRRNFLDRLVRFYRTVGSRNLIPELWYALLLRLDGRVRRALACFRAHTPPLDTAVHNPPKTIVVDSVNSREVHRLLQKLSPDLMVIWGSSVVAPHILGTAKKSINLHLGVCPQYRGAVANQFAFLRGDRKHIGATIHYAAKHVDTGDILLTILADTRKPPREMFRELNDRVHEFYLDIAHKLFRGETLPSTPQDVSQGENVKLSQWTPRVRYVVGKRLHEWEDSFARRASMKGDFDAD